MRCPAPAPPPRWSPAWRQSRIAAGSCRPGPSGSSAGGWMASGRLGSWATRHRRGGPACRRECGGLGSWCTHRAQRCAAVPGTLPQLLMGASASAPCPRSLPPQVGPLYSPARTGRPARRRCRPTNCPRFSAAGARTGRQTAAWMRPPASRSTRPSRQQAPRGCRAGGARAASGLYGGGAAGPARGAQGRGGGQGECLHAVLATHRLQQAPAAETPSISSAGKNAPLRGEGCRRAAAARSAAAAGSRV